VKNTVYFDLETQKSAEEVGGWHRIRDMRMSVGVTFSTARNGYRVYGEAQVNDLVEELRRADLVVGFNHLRFDYEVLNGYTILDLTQTPNLDLLVELQKTLNHRLTLDSVASATLGAEKTADGPPSPALVQGRQVDGDRRILLLRRQNHQTGPRIRP
jgi:DEAD/DEAH box helicase domain-containing protein